MMTGNYYSEHEPSCKSPCKLVPECKTKAALADERSEYDALRGELATIFGPGKPRKGESRASYWLRRIGDFLAGQDSAITQSETALARLREAALQVCRDWRDGDGVDVGQAIIELRAALAETTDRS